MYIKPGMNQTFVNKIIQNGKIINIPLTKHIFSTLVNTKDLVYIYIYIYIYIYNSISQISFQLNNHLRNYIIGIRFIFRATFFFPKDGAWGALDPETGMMSGMIGELQRGNADIAVNALDFTLLRSQYVDYPVDLDSFG